MVLLILLLYAIAGGTGYAAYCFSSVALSAVHEIEGLLCVVMAVIALTGAITCTVLATMGESLVRQLRLMHTLGHTPERTEAHL